MRASAIAAALLVAPCALVACGAREPQLPVPLGLDLYTHIPADNPITSERVELGRKLFFDASLSADGTVSCSSCHKPEHAFADTVAVPKGAYGRAGSRNAPSLLNVTYRAPLFWDGRAPRIEDQVLRPLQSATEMDRSLEDLVMRVSADSVYARLFRRAFDEEVNADGIARALATFVRTLRSGNSAFDRATHGDSAALSPDARFGMAVFMSKGRCSSCHGGPTFSDGLFHNTGVAAAVAGVTGVFDVGRFTVTGDSSDLGAFRTPSLRNVALTRPYMHDGSIKTLPEVIDFYDKGGHVNPQLDERLRPLRLTDHEIRGLVAFLESLTDPGLVDRR